MNFTGEFFTPYDAEDGINNHAELEIEHKQRYLSILKLVEGKTVLDIASGEGYGTSILADKAMKVFGVDINPELVDHAARKYNRENLRFLNGSADQIPLESNSVDIVVSFETLEHVDAPTQKNFLAEVRRVLRTNGVFIVSTPDKKNYTDRFNHHNSFHIHELYESEFEELLKAHFSHIRVYHQGLEVSSMILDKEHFLSRKPVTIIPVSNAYQFEGKYLIALCSDLSESIQIPIASIVPESEKSYFQLIDRILSLQKEVEELGAWGRRSNEELDSIRIAFQQLETHLAHANHATFLKEAELEVLRQEMSGSGPIHPGTDRIIEEVANLIRQVADLSIQNRMIANIEIETNISSLKKQIEDLQNTILWYKKTYEERSFLGVIKQKIDSKFSK